MMRVVSIGSQEEGSLSWIGGKLFLNEGIEFLRKNNFKGLFWDLFWLRESRVFPI